MRVYVLPSAKIATPIGRAQYARYWRTRFEKLRTYLREDDQLDLSEGDNADYHRARSLKIA